MYFSLSFFDPDLESPKMERRRYFQLDKKQLNSYTSQWVLLGEDIILPADWSWGDFKWVDLNQSIISIILDVPLRLMPPQPQSTRTNSRRVSQHQSPSLTTNLKTTVFWDCKDTNPMRCHFLVVYVFEYLPEQNWLSLWKYWRRDRCLGDSNNHNPKHNCYNYNLKLKCKMFLFCKTCVQRIATSSQQTCNILK